MERFRASPAVCLVLACALLPCAGAFGLDVVDQTVADTVTGAGSWYGGTTDDRTGVFEDNETETPPNTVQAQDWDLEAVYQTTTINGVTNWFSLAGGWDFANGAPGWNFISGDIFIAVDYVPVNDGVPPDPENPNPTGAGYDYVFDFDWANSTNTNVAYTIWAISTAAGNGSDLTVGSGLEGITHVSASNPWRYVSGSTRSAIGSGTAQFVNYTSDNDFFNAINAAGRDSAEPEGYGGVENHYLLTNLSVAPVIVDWMAQPGNDKPNTLYTHFTQQCGNDMLQGSLDAPIVFPEPATFSLLGVALAGLGLRRSMRSKA
jgi:hypothetical protein